MWFTDRCFSKKDTHLDLLKNYSSLFRKSTVFDEINRIYRMWSELLIEDTLNPSYSSTLVFLRRIRNICFFSDIEIYQDIGDIIIIIICQTDIRDFELWLALDLISGFREIHIDQARTEFALIKIRERQSTSSQYQQARQQPPQDTPC